ncbi:Shs13 protein [Schizophyllum fasciatum]
MYATLNRLFVFVAAALLAVPAFATPVPHTTMIAGNSYSGAGGMAPGGSVNNPETDGESGLGDLHLLDLMSNNAGNGGDAGSGSGAVGGSSHCQSRITRDNARDHWNRRNMMESGNAYTGAGGNAAGGNANGHHGLISVLSGNAGDGGNGDSSSALVGGC